MTTLTIDRLLSALDAETDECVKWPGATYKWGHGHVIVRRIDFAVHRLIWEMLRGPIPTGLCVCHHCDIPECANIRHLFLGTQQDNIDDMWKKGRGGPRSYPRPWLRGTKSHFCKLTEEQVFSMREDRARGLSYKQLGTIYGVHSWTAARVIKGMTHRTESSIRALTETSETL